MMRPLGCLLTSPLQQPTTGALVPSDFPAMHRAYSSSTASTSGPSQFPTPRFRLAVLRQSPLQRFCCAPSQRGQKRRSTTPCQAVAQQQEQQRQPSQQHEPGNQQGQAQAQRQCTYDVVSFGNLCVDVVLSVPQLPPSDKEQRWQLLQQLQASPPDSSTKEVGGACNFMIAAARLGMQVGCVGQVADDAYGTFLRDVMKAEGVDSIQPVLAADQELQQTLLCFVLVGPDGGHAFCSAYDFGPWPLLGGEQDIPHAVHAMLRDTRAVYLNGFVFDELEPELVAAVARAARAAGAAVFFDPGPRCWTLLEGRRRAALDELLSLSDVVLMTEEEAAAVTGCGEAHASARWVLERPGTATEWCVVKKGGEGAVLCTRVDRCTTFTAEAYKVDVRDTVGCGDSFAAAVVMGYTKGHSVPTVMALANAVGAATAMGNGAGRNVASVDDVAGLLLSSVDANDLDDCVHAAALDVLQNAVPLDVSTKQQRPKAGSNSGSPGQ